MATSTSKELLELEKRIPSFTESSILICKKGVPLSEKSGNNSKKMKIDEGVDGRPSTGDVPRSQVLGKVKDFLGMMAEANKQLELNMHENPHINYDIEAITGSETEYIEMDLLLGVADLRTEAAVAAAEAAIGGSKSSLPSSDGIGCSESGTEDSSSDDDSSNGSDNENHNCDPCLGRKSKSTKSLGACKPNKRPKIVVLD